jgi:hypothetical protein
MRKSLLALALLALVLPLPGCNDETEGGDQVTQPEGIVTEATIAELSVTVAPVLVPAVATGDPGFPWQISWVTTVRETAGVAATVQRISVFLVDAKLVLGPAEVAQLGSPNLAARGSTTFNQTIFYALPNGGRLAVVTVIVDVVDSRGNSVSAEAQLRII